MKMCLLWEFGWHCMAGVLSAGDPECRWPVHILTGGLICMDWVQSTGGLLVTKQQDSIWWGGISCGNGLGMHTNVFIRCVTVTGAGAGLSWPLCATASPRCAGCPWPAGFPVWLGTWALSSCAHLVLLLGQEAVSTALLSCETRLVKAMWSCLFQSSKWRACPFRIAPRLTWDFF